MRKSRLLTGFIAAAVSVSMLAAPVMAQAATPHVVDEKLYYALDSEWVLNSEQIFTYDSKGKIKTYAYDYYAYGGSLEYTSKTSYTYDSNNRLKKTEYKKSDDKTSNSTDKYSYGKNSSTIKFYNYKGKYIGKDVTKYTYYSNKKLKKSTSSFYNEKNKLKSKDIYNYNKS